MKIDFGKVERYIEDRGFGFVSHTFAGSPSKEVFFHIKSIKRTHPELALALSGHDFHTSLCFWYEFEILEKGAQVIAILDPRKIWENYPDNKSKLVEVIEKSWLSPKILLSETIKKATFELLPPDEIYQLEVRRDILEEAVAGSECNTVIELKREHHAASPRLLASLRPSPRSGI